MAQPSTIQPAPTSAGRLDEAVERTLPSQADLDNTPGARDQADPLDPTLSFVPKVNSREDYENLSSADRNTFNRSRRPPLTIFANFDAAFAAAADLDGEPGDVAVTRLGASYGPSFRVNETADLAFRFETEWSNYDFSGTQALFPGFDEPFGEVLVFGVSPVLNVVNPGGWNYTIGARIVSSIEGGADFGDGLTYGGFASASYPVLPNLRIGFGALVASELSSDNIFFIPIPYIEWQITDRLTLGSRRPGLGLIYEPSFGWQVGVEAGFDRREFRLDGEGPLPDGVVIDSSISAAFVLGYSPHPRFSVTGRVGSVIWGRFEFFDDTQFNVTDVERETALFGGLSITVRF